jgi:hypothetical protein
LRSTFAGSKAQPLEYISGCDTDGATIDSIDLNPRNAKRFGVSDVLLPTIGKDYRMI